MALPTARADDFASLRPRPPKKLHWSVGPSKKRRSAYLDGYTLGWRDCLVDFLRSGKKALFYRGRWHRSGTRLQYVRELGRAKGCSECQDRIKRALEGKSPPQIKASCAKALEQMKKEVAEINAKELVEKKLLYPIPSYDELLEFNLPPKEAESVKLRFAMLEFQTIGNMECAYGECGDIDRLRTALLRALIERK